MPNGMEIYDKQRVVLSLTDRITSVLGQFDTTSSNGSIMIEKPEFSGNLWAYLLSQASYNSVDNQPPELIVSGSTIFWSFDYLGPDFSRRPATVIYGVY